MPESNAIQVGETGIVIGEVAFEDFYRASRNDVVRAVVLAVVTRELGIEAADEAFTRAFERWETVRAFDNPQGWVYRVALNWARSRLRRRRPEVGGLFDEPSYIDDLPEPELFAAIESLSFAYRSVLVARFFLDWSIEQTAAALDLPEGTVKTRQSRALDRLRKRLEVAR